ncbi:unnamed protein product [Euphydryas editha]|uniref:Regulatory protein zeste n=1 Tax=Euphydryas editha TaxID=104508 RepID=A0AAU9TRN8_EUPED|nr:unnamed protein product [Euphydryas editha]
MKEDAWKIITGEFNSSVVSFPRTTSQLRLKWENLKKSALKRCANLRSNLMKTGGGKDYFPPDEILDKVASLLGSTCTGFSVEFGGDATQINNLVLDEMLTVVEEEETGNDVNGVGGSGGGVGGSGGGDYVSGENVADQVEVLKELEISFTPKSEKKSFYFGKASGSGSLAKRKFKIEEEKSKARINRDNALTEYIIAKKKKLDLDIAKIEMELENSRLENIRLKRNLNLID